MPTSQIVPFATAPGANVQDLTSYTAAAATAAGFSAGVANSGALNRAWRQASFMAAGLAGLLVANGVDVLDDGDLTALTNKLKNLFSSSLTPYGFQQLPGGWILQWGFGPPSDSSGVSIVSFPTAFPNTVLHVCPFYEGSGSTPPVNPPIVSAGVTTPSGARLFTWNGTAISGGITPSYFAIGK